MPPPAVLLLVLAAGCAVHAVDRSPAPLVEPPAGFPSRPPGADADASAAPWWAGFDDPTLDALIREALAGAYEVDEALARLARARARAAQAGAPLRPIADAVGAAGVTGGDAAFDTVEAGLVASWELDLFGRLRAARAAATRDAAASAAALEDVRLALSADVADAYFSAREQHLQLRLLEQQLELARILVEITELRFAQGVASAVDVLQQQSQLAETEALVPPARASRRVAENRLDVLLGRAPDGEDRVAGETFDPLPPLPATGVPSDLLLRRPDLRARLHAVAARDHDVAQAVADRFPRLFLTGSLGWSDVDGDDAWSGGLAAELIAPLTDGGFRRAVVDEREAALREEVAALTGAFLRAVEEVDGALWLEARQREELSLLQRRERILSANVAEARNRYANGLTDYLPVAIAVESVQETQRDVLARRRALYSRRVALHRALGGALPGPAD